MPRTSARTVTATPIRKATTAVAVVFLAVGVLGFVPGVTTNADAMTFAGHRSDAHLFGVFEVSVLHNCVHLLFGVVGLGLANSFAGARWYLIGGGVVYLVLWIYGLVIDKASAANFIPLNRADDWLHFGLGFGMIVLGLALSRRLSAAGSTPARR